MSNKKALVVAIIGLSIGMIMFGWMMFLFGQIVGIASQLE